MALRSKPLAPWGALATWATEATGQDDGQRTALVCVSFWEKKTPPGWMIGFSWLFETPLELPTNLTNPIN